MLSYIDNLKEVIYNLHQVVAKHVGSEEITEPATGPARWSGIVDIFELAGHSTATHCFAWEETCGPNHEELRYMAILSSPTLRTPRQAIQKALAQEDALSPNPRPKMSSTRRRAL